MHFLDDKKRSEKVIVTETGLLHMVRIASKTWTKGQDRTTARFPASPESGFHGAVWVFWESELPNSSDISIKIHATEPKAKLKYV